jgi:hypothetical protein
MDPREDIIGSAKPPEPPKPQAPQEPRGLHDLERRKQFLLHVVAIAAVAAAAFSGITAWETHQDRRNSKAFYCAFASNPGDNDPTQKELSEQLDC